MFLVNSYKLNVEVLYCRECTRLTSVPVIPELKTLDCTYCTSLTSLPTLSAIPHLILSCDGCKWIERDNNDFKQNLSSLIQIQLYVKKHHKIRLMRKWLKTEDFAMWYYHPKNPGGLRAKKKIMRFLQDIK